MSGGVVLVIVVVLFILVIIGFNNDVNKRNEASEQKRIKETNAAKIKQLKQEIKPKNLNKVANSVNISKKTKKEETNEYVQITNDYFNQLRFELGIMYIDAEPDENGLYTILKSDLIEAEQSLKESKEMQRILAISTEHYKNALKFEKSGEIDKAIEEYEKSISLEYTWVHSFVRLAKIYEHREMYSDMVRVCKIGIKYHSGYSPMDNLINEINEKYVIDWTLE